MGVIEDKVKRELDCCTGRITDFLKIQHVSQALNLDSLLEENDGVYLSSYSGIEIDAKTFERAAALGKALLPTIGKLEKSFDEYSGTVCLSGTFNEIKVSINSEPSTACKIRLEETEEYVPGHTEKRRKYVLDGECNPLLSILDSEEQSEQDSAAGA